MRPGFWLLVAVTTGAIVSSTWMRWMDPQIDFGWQLYLPWRLSLGEHLGRDYVHAYGPLSPYFNAALFKIFGTSVVTLVTANLVIYGIIVVLLYKLLRMAFGFTGAALGTLVGIIVFGFGNHSWIWNYTYAAPYCHEATHGIALLLGLLLLLARSHARPSLSGWPAGLVFGLVCLTKVEITFAAAIAILAAAFLRAPSRPAEAPRLLWLTELGSGAVGVLAATCLALGVATDAPNALRVVAGGTLSPWLYGEYTHDAFSVAILGLDNTWGNVRALLQIGLGCTAYVVGLTLILKWTARKSLSGWRAAAVATIALALLVGSALLLKEHSIRAGRAFPLLMLVGGAALAFRLYRGTGAALTPRSFAQLLLWIVAMAMMARVMLAPKVYHYGFYLTMLAGVWLTGFFIVEWPRLTVRRSPWRFFLGAELAATAMLAAAFLFTDSLQHYGARTKSLGNGRDEIRGLDLESTRAHSIIESTRQFISQSTPENATVLVMPEGVMLNYWTRRKHPLKIADTLPATLRLNGAPVLANLEKSAPDYIVLMTRTAATEHKPFGSDAESGQELLDWLTRKYTVVAHAGPNPLLPYNGKDFGVRVLQKAPPTLQTIGATD